MKLSSIVKVINIFEKRIYHKNLFCTHQKIMYLNLKQNSHFIQDEINYIPWRKERLPTPVFLASLVAQLVKNLPTIWETWVRSLGWEDPLEKGKATHFSILAWRIPWTV